MNEGRNMTPAEMRDVEREAREWARERAVQQRRRAFRRDSAYASFLALVLAQREEARR
jgi:hypothetical protein